MSDDTRPVNPDGSPSRPPPHGGGCATALLVLAGVILLLPGLCTVILFNGHVGDSDIAPITTITFAVAFCGLILIVVGLRRL